MSQDVEAPLISLAEAAAILQRDGEVVAIPTETVYGLAALAKNRQSVQKIYTLKNRPSNNPLILHVSSIEELEEYADCSGLSISSRALFSLWPGPLTLVLPRKKGSDALLAQQIYCDLPTIAIRIPSHPLLLELIKQVGPIVAPSANRSGLPSPTSFYHIIQDYQDTVAILADQKPFCLHGLESTILTPVDALSESESGLQFADGSFWKLLRCGAYSLMDISGLIKGGCRPVFASPHNFVPCDKSTEITRPIAPGQLLAHYRPKASVHLGSQVGRWNEGEPVIGLHGRNYPGAHVLHLFDPDQPQTLMPHFYHLLRETDRLGLESLFIDDVFLQITSPPWQTLRERFMRCSCQS